MSRRATASAPIYDDIQRRAGITVIHISHNFEKR